MFSWVLARVVSMTGGLLPHKSGNDKGNLLDNGIVNTLVSAERRARCRMHPGSTNCPVEHAGSNRHAGSLLAMVDVLVCNGHKNRCRRTVTPTSAE